MNSVFLATWFFLSQVTGINNQPVIYAKVSGATEEVIKGKTVYINIENILKHNEIDIKKRQELKIYSYFRMNKKWILWSEIQSSALPTTEIKIAMRPGGTWSFHFHVGEKIKAPENLPIHAVVTFKHPKSD